MKNLNLILFSVFVVGTWASDTFLCDIITAPRAEEAQTSDATIGLHSPPIASVRVAFDCDYLNPDFPNKATLDETKKVLLDTEQEEKKDIVVHCDYHRGETTELKVQEEEKNKNKDNTTETGFETNEDCNQYRCCNEDGVALDDRETLKQKDRMDAILLELGVKLVAVTAEDVEMHNAMDSVQLKQFWDGIDICDGYTDVIPKLIASKGNSVVTEAQKEKKDKVNAIQELGVKTVPVSAEDVAIRNAMDPIQLEQFFDKIQVCEDGCDSCVDMIEIVKEAKKDDSNYYKDEKDVDTMEQTSKAVSTMDVEGSYYYTMGGVPVDKIPLEHERVEVVLCEREVDTNQKKKEVKKVKIGVEDSNYYNDAKNVDAMEKKVKEDDVVMEESDDHKGGEDVDTKDQAAVLIAVGSGEKSGAVVMEDSEMNKGKEIEATMEKDAKEDKVVIETEEKRKDGNGNVILEKKVKEANEDESGGAVMEESDDHKGGKDVDAMDQAADVTAVGSGEKSGDEEESDQAVEEKLKIGMQKRLVISYCPV